MKHCASAGEHVAFGEFIASNVSLLLSLSPYDSTQPVSRDTGCVLGGTGDQDGSNRKHQFFGKQGIQRFHILMVITAHFGTTTKKQVSTGRLIQPLKLAQQTENYVAEAVTPMKHQELEQPDVFFPPKLVDIELVLVLNTC